MRYASGQLISDSASYTRNLVVFPVALRFLLGIFLCAANASVGGRYVTYSLKRISSKYYRHLARIYVFSFKN